MIRMFSPVNLAALLMVTLTACTPQSQIDSSKSMGMAAPSAAAVDAKRLIQADSEPGEWMTHGRTYSEQRYSPLTQINVDNVAELGLAWSYDLKTKRGIEATSLMVNGVV
ncbi:MAG: PQQ-dependent dehydrogenase, methanol/ethanol family, partial [Halioglobus sp.]|nr:PQQ-dependent dehydrogenase, methanol/ethanol family [Halioglobus sp.]